MARDISISRKKRRKFVLGFRRRKPDLGCMTVLNYFLWVVQLLVLATVLFPLVVVYLVGLYISTGISVWRLIQHDYGNAEGGANRKPALVVLYSLGVAQGAFHSYKALYTWVKGVGLVEDVALGYSMEENLISEYLQETLMGCANHPMFSRRRNLVTYAVDLMMEPKSNDKYLAGVQILGTFLQRPLWDLTISGQPDQIRELLTKSASYGHMIQRLIETMGTRSPDSTEIREHAARIVAHVADAIPLRYFPGGTNFLSFLLNTVEDYRGPSGEDNELGSKWQHSRARMLHFKYLREWLPKRRQDPPSAWPESGGNWLVVQGLRIIQNLSADEDNCRIIIATEGLMSKITAPLKSDQLHQGHHDKWSEIAEELLKLMSRLMATPGETGRKLRSELSGNNTEVISALKSITACSECEVLLIRRAIQIYLDLSLDPSNIMDYRTSSTKFTWILLHIFLVPDDCFDKIRGSDPNKKAKDKSSDIVDTGF